MRLIDADAITESKELARKVKVINLDPYINVNDLLEFIDNLPTAYNVEKVVEQLEDMIQPCYECKEDCNEKCVIEKAIDIVRNGGKE